MLTVPCSLPSGACCGSTIRSPAVANLSPFQRFLPPLTVDLSDAASQTKFLFSPPGRVGDLRVEMVPMEVKARLTWTAPDMGGVSVSRYEVKYAKKLSDLVSRATAVFRNSA